MSKDKPDWEGYDEKWKYTVEYYRVSIDGYRSSAFEYGILIVKNLFILNGGALVALPALASLDNFESFGSFYLCAALYVAGILLVMAASFVIHLNWAALEASEVESRDRSLRRMSLDYLGPEYQDEDVVKAETVAGIPKKKTINLYYYLGYIFGLSSFAAFVSSTYLLLGYQLLQQS